MLIKCYRLLLQQVYKLLTRSVQMMDDIIKILEFVAHPLVVLLTLPKIS